MAAKNGAKNGTRKRVGRPFAKGQNGGHHGKPGRSGRPTLAFKAECERAAREVVLPKLVAYVERHTPDDAGYRWAAEQLLSHGIGKPAQTVLHQGDADKPLEITVEYRQQLTRRVDSIANRIGAGAFAGVPERN